MKLRDLRISRCTKFFTAILAAAALHSARAEEKKPSPGFEKNPFGIKADGVTSPGMADALKRLMEAGQIEGRKGSLTFLRWADAKPPRLQHLGLWGPRVTDEVLTLTMHTPDLQHISLYETNVTDAGVAALAKLTGLRSLAITPVNRYEKPGFQAPQWSYSFLPARPDRPRITAQGIRALGGAQGIESLDLLDTRLSSADLQILAGWPKLSSVALPGPVDAEAVRHLGACKRLGSLTLGHREIAAAEIEALTSLASLRRLTVVHARLSDDALRALSKLATVQEITLEDCDLTDERLQHLNGSPKLATLSLERNAIRGPGAAHLAKMKLTTLSLAWNDISDDTLPHLTQLTTVTDLRIPYCRQVTDRGIQGGILQSMKHLRELNIRGLQRVTDASLDDLARLGHLAHLGIRETKISTEGVARLKQAMPATTVFK